MIFYVKRFRLNFLPLIIAMCIAICLYAAQPSDSDVRKADYIFMEAANAERIDDAYYLLRRAHALNPADTFIAAKIAEIELMLPGTDSVVQERSYKAIRNRYLAEKTNDYYARMYASLAAQSGRIDDVIEVWEDLDRLQQQRSEPALNLAQALLSKYNATLDTSYYNRALALFNRLESRLGPTPELAYRKVTAYLLRNDTSAILSTLADLRRAAPADVPAQLLVGNVFEHLGMADSALACYDRAAVIDPENGAVYLSRADFFRSRGDSVAYDREVFKALESIELDFEQKLELLTGYVTTLYTDSLQWPRINEMFSVIQEINPGEAKLHDFYASYNRAIGQNRQAAEQLSYSIDLDPSDPNRWQDLILLYFNLEDTASIYDMSDKALMRYPSEPVFVLFKTAALRMMDRNEDALSLLSGIDTLVYPNRLLESNLYSTRADVLSQLGREDEGLADYLKAIEANPENYMAMNNWAYFNAERGTELDKAELYASIACAGEPDNCTVLDTYAWVLYKKKEYEKALEAIERALASCEQTSEESEESEKVRQEPSADVYDHAGDIYFWNHDLEKAVFYWKKALELDPDNKLIKKKVRERTFYFE